MLVAAECLFECRARVSAVSEELEDFGEVEMCGSLDLELNGGVGSPVGSGCDRVETRAAGRPGRSRSCCGVVSMNRDVASAEIASVEISEEE